MHKSSASISNFSSGSSLVSSRLTVAVLHERGPDELIHEEQAARLQDITAPLHRGRRIEHVVQRVFPVHELVGWNGRFQECILDMNRQSLANSRGMGVRASLFGTRG